MSVAAAACLTGLGARADDLPAGVVNTQNPTDVSLSPQESLVRITVPEGFHVTLFAGEPAVRRPIAFDFDDRGRLWVVENYSHPQWKVDGASDRIIILEDADQDGRFAFKDVATGSQNLKATTTGYSTYSVQIEVQSGQNNHDISLIRKAHYQFVSIDGNHDLYLPPGVSTFRGVIFLGNPSGVDARGFASGNPMNSVPGRDELIALDRERSLQLAEKHELALMGSEGVTNGRVTDTILAALEQFATESAHPELAQAPLLMTGFSLGGCLAYRFAQDRPQRTIGFMAQKG